VFQISISGGLRPPNLPRGDGADESTLFIRIYFEIFLSGAVYEIATNVYFLWSVTDFAKLGHIHTSESEMDLNCH